MMPSREAGELPLSPIEEILADLQAGKGVVVLDDVGRENEGDVIFATEAVTPEAVAFLMREARGLICAKWLRDEDSMRRSDEFIVNPIVDRYREPSIKDCEPRTE
jgi:3,4-dihydroxy 2-butanone 4-phosphate synthase/GTP cyclohydrolase II